MKTDENFAIVIGVILFVAFSLALLGSWFTLLAVNTLFAKEIVEITIESVLALAWIKFMIGGLFSGILKVNFKQYEVK
jgi:hypothetical protein